MASDTPNSAGAVSVEIRPDGKTFEPALKALVVSAATRVAADLAKALSAQIPKQLSDAIKQGIRDGGEQAKVDAAKSGQSAGAAFAEAFRKTVSDKTGDAPVGPGRAPSTKGGTESGGAFADAFKKRVDAALKSLPDAKIGADATEADRAVAEIAAELKALHGQKIGIDISDEVAVGQIADIREQIDRLSADSASVKVRVDLAAASAQLAAFQGAVDKVAIDSPTVTVDVDAGEAVAELGAVEAASTAVGASGASASSGMGLLGTSIISLGPAALPVLAAIAAATAGIGPVAIGVGAGLGVTALGFHGIAAAVEAMGKEQDKASTSTGGLASKQFAEAAAADQVRSATAALANTRSTATSQEIQSAEQVASAQQQLAQAESSAKSAEDALTQSRVAATQSLEDLNNQVIDNAQAQRQGAIDLTNAKSALNSANSAANAAPQNAALQLARTQAQLNFDEAVQHNKELAISQQRLVDQQTAANKAGIEGSQQVVTAKASEVQANQQVAQSQQAVADARRQQADQARQSAFAIQQAEQGVVSAQRAVAQAAQGSAAATAASTSAADQALAKLGPAGQKFAKFIFSLQGDVKKTQDIAEAGLLPGAETAIKTLLPFLPQVDGFVGKLSTSVGGLFVEAARAFTDPFWLKFFGLLGGTAVPALEGTAHAVGNLTTGAAGLIEAFLPLDKQVGSGLLAFTARISAAGQNLDHNGGFQDFLKFVETEGPVVVHTVDDIVGAAVHLVEALAPLGVVELAAVRDFANAIKAIPVPVLTAAAFAFVAINTVLKLQAGYTAAAKVASTLAGVAQTGWNAAVTTYNFLLGRQPGLAAAATAPTEALATAQGEGAASTEALAAAIAGLTTAIAPTAVGVESLTLAEIELAVQMEAVDAAAAAAAASNEALGVSMSGAAAAAVELAGAEVGAGEAVAGAETASSGFASFLGGPWGIALGIAAVALGAFLTQSKGNKDEVDGLVTSLGQLSTAYKNVGSDSGTGLRSLIAQNSQIASIVQTASQAGISLNGLTDALNGNKAAGDQVNAAFTAQAQALENLYLKLDGEDSPGNGGSLASLYEAAGVAAGTSEEKVGDLVQTFGDQQVAVQKVIEKSQSQALAQQAVNSAVAKSLGLAPDATQAQIDMATAYKTLSDQASTAAQKLDAVKTIEEGSRGAAADVADITEKQAADYDALTNSVKQLTDAHDKHSHSLDINTAAGRQNNDYIVDSAKDLVTAYNNNIANGDSIEVATGKYDLQRAALEDHTKKLGLNNTAVQTLLNTYGEIPTDPKLEITVTGVSQVLNQLEQLQIAQLALSTGFPIDVATKEYINQHKKATQVFGGLAAGGPVVGPGTKTSDDVPIWASAGEFMQPSHAVDYYGLQGMEAIRSHAIPKELLQGLAKGGSVWPFHIDARHTKIPSLAQALAVVHAPAAHSTPITKSAPGGHGAIAAFADGGYIPPGLTPSVIATQPMFVGATQVDTSTSAGGSGSLVSIGQFIAGSASAQEIAGELAWDLKYMGG